MSPLKENKELKQTLQEERNRLSEEFLAELIHKLNNCLVPVQGFSQILLLKLTSPDNRENAERIIKEAGRISGILGGLSDYIKKREPQKERVDINELVRKTVEARTNELRNIQVSTGVTPFIPLTQADPGQIQSVLFNLIENAEHAVSEFQGEGKIRIETKVRGEDIEIIVTDDGPGIAQEDISKIFNPLFTTKKNRMGLGLSISNKIVESHGGEIEVKTERGKGTSFIITLPIISSLVEKDKEKQLLQAKLNQGKGEGKMLTKEQKEKYLRYPGNCPHCGSYELSYDKVTFDASKVWHEISCSKCNKRWADIYSLTDLEEID